MLKVKTKKRIVRTITIVLLGIFCFIGNAQAASIFLSPSSGVYQINKNVTVTVFVSSPDQALNAVSGVLVFPTDKLEVVSITKTNSIINLWVQEPSYSNKSGTVNFEGIVLNPGYTGGNARVINITFKTKTAGTAALKLSNAQILANDGTGTNITKTVGGASFTLKAAEVKPVPTPTEPTVVKPTTSDVSLAITSATHPDQTKWYKNNSPEFTWEKKSGVSAVKLSLSKIDEKSEGKTYSPAIWERSLSDVDDGIYYFYVQPKVGQVWGKESSYKVQIDSIPPTDVALELLDKNEVALHAKDSGSGIEKYVLRFDDGESYDVLSVEGQIIMTSSLPSQFSGKQAVSLEAVDRAGNSSLSKIKAPIVQKAVGPQVSVPILEVIKGNTVSIVGKSNASAKVIISVEYKGKISEYQTIADVNGNFVYVWDALQSVGVYKIWAQELSNAGVRGDGGNQVFVTVAQTRLMQTLRVLLGYTAVIALILSVVVIFLALVVVVFRRVFRRNIQ